MTKQTKIKCPHCGLPITIRQADDIPDKIWKSFDDIFKAIDDAFKKVFGK